MIARSMLHLHQLKRNLRSNPLSLRKTQNQKLRAILKHAYENVPFYHKKFRSAGIRPSDIKTVEELNKVPFTAKSEIQAAPFGDVVERNLDRKNCIERLTSGSTGIPLTVFVDSNVIDLENAVWIRAYFENGMKPWHKMLRLTDPRNFASGHWYQHLGLMRTKFVSVFDDNQKQLSAIEEYKPDVIRGYSSCLESLADFCKDNTIHTKTPLVFTSAELLDVKARQTINSAFGTELFDLYVSVEFGLMAWECDGHLGYHVNADSLVLEFVDDGGVVAPGERGEVVGTNLFNGVMPLIRYRIGDVGVASDEQCSCGRTLPLMEIVEGRTGNYLTALDGRIIPPIVFFPYPFEDTKGIRQFKVIQEKRDKLLIVLAPRGNNLSRKVLEKAERNLKGVFGEGMHVEFQIVEKIEKDPTGKLRKIISHVPTDIGGVSP